MTRLTWPEYGMELAKTAALRSEDPHRKVGTCIMRPDHTVAALGFNGAPSGVEIDWTNRDERRLWVIHAEANALRYVVPGEANLVVTTSLPCASCMLLIASYGIREVVYRDELDPAVYDRDLIMDIAAKSGITVVKAEANLA